MIRNARSIGGILLIVLFLILAGGFARNVPCRFAKLYSSNDLLDETKQKQFLMDVATWESKFHQDGIGYHAFTGITYDGHGLDYTTGLKAEPLHAFTAASKEGLHLAMLAKALDGHPLAVTFLGCKSVDEAVKKSGDILFIKIITYLRFKVQFPGYAGWLPWVKVNSSGIYPVDGWWNRVPALDNGEMLWGIYSVMKVLEQKHPHLDPLRRSYRSYWEYLSSTAKMVFYSGNGKVSAVTAIADVYAQPSPANYKTEDPTYLLDDPYEGELFTWFLDLFTTWEDPSERELLWIVKRAKLQSVDYESKRGPITVQRGYWFSAHEQWKYLQMPYLSVEISRRIFNNCERARVAYSAENNIPGLYASVSNWTVSGPVREYVSALGVPSIAFQKILYKDLVTPYGSFNLFLANTTAALQWYHRMLLTGKMQGPYGTTEASSASGLYISPVVTWDSKITTLLAMTGGTGSIVEEGLRTDGKFNRFQEVINREWSRVFPSLKGEDLDYAFPPQTPPPEVPDFTECHL